MFAHAFSLWKQRRIHQPAPPLLRFQPLHFACLSALFQKWVFETRSKVVHWRLVFTLNRPLTAARILLNSTPAEIQRCTCSRFTLQFAVHAPAIRHPFTLDTTRFTV
jgi:hypothetical protein